MNNPGKFEACENETLAQHLQELSLDGGCDDEIGDVATFGWYGLLLDADGIGENKSYIIQEDNNGFFTYSTHSHDEAIATFDEIKRQYEDEFPEDN